MIRNLEGNETVEALIALAQAGFDFRLNGSRYFGTQHDESDWDFYCDPNDDILEYLEYSRFTLLGNNDKEEPTQRNRSRYFSNRGNSTRTHAKPPETFPKVPATCKRSDVIAVYRRGKVDVQVVKNAEVRERFLRYLKEHVPTYKAINKIYHKVVYQFFFDIIYGNVMRIGDYPELLVKFVLPGWESETAVPQFKAFAEEFFQTAA